MCQPCSSLAYPPRCGMSAFRVLLSENLLLRLKPAIKRIVTDASFVVLEGVCGDPFVERC